MSVTVSGSTLVEVPGVAGAIEHLQELCKFYIADPTKSDCVCLF